MTNLNPRSFKVSLMNSRKLSGLFKRRTMSAGKIQPWDWTDTVIVSIAGIVRVMALLVFL